MVTIYILKCEDDKYYVGKTYQKDPYNRIQDHFNGNGSLWTQKHQPLEVMSVITHCDDEDEDKHTKIMMKKYGINNVRGGTYCRIKLRPDEYRVISRELRGNNGLCYQCGKKGHFARDCPALQNACGNQKNCKHPETEVQPIIPFRSDIANNLAGFVMSITNNVSPCMHQTPRIYISNVEFNHGNTKIYTNAYGVTKLRELPYIKLYKHLYTVITSKRHFGIFTKDNYMILQGIHPAFTEGYYNLYNGQGDNDTLVYVFNN